MEIMRQRSRSHEEATPKHRAKSVAGPPMTLAQLQRGSSRQYGSLAIGPLSLEKERLQDLSRAVCRQREIGMVGWAHTLEPNIQVQDCKHLMMQRSGQPRGWINPPVNDEA